ncbi:hypothetical protein AB4072_00950 [Microvirga sp. 2MCAF38]|uniref:hypothetical protein n=1 Tax=Microvirga sp. 2MCAF38 TaxID=3232989 RepID=UPI003F9C790C
MAPRDYSDIVMVGIVSSLPALATVISLGSAFGWRMGGREHLNDFAALAGSLGGIHGAACHTLGT